MNTTIRLTVLLLALLLSIASCGGGTIGTGLTSLSKNTRASDKLSFSAHLKVITPNEKPCVHAAVTVSSHSGIVSRSAGPEGVATLPLLITSGEILMFSVKCGANVYESSDYLSPAGAQEIYRTLQLRPDGSLEVGE